MVGDLGGVVFLRLLIELSEALFCSVGVVVLSWLRELVLGVLLKALCVSFPAFGDGASPAFDVL